MKAKDKNFYFNKSAFVVDFFFRCIEHSSNIFVKTVVFLCPGKSNYNENIKELRDSKKTLGLKWKLTMLGI
jgi:hypothetical protein